MSSTNFERLKQWFEQLADLMPEQRLAFLREAQGIDEDTRRQLIDLLAMDDQLAGSTARPALRRVATDTTDEDMLGRAIGPYVIVKALGRGGMGRVFLADRADGSITQQVAIKIVRPELLDAHTIARFHLERQVLALLKHPHIATLMDAGELEPGSPYVVMEYVEGQAITDYANAHRLGVRDRLQLFLKVCDAVAFAHRNLIVHRDLKPGNVLVTADAQPKLLDFGIAKPLLGAIGTIDVQDTSAAQRFFSPHNAAPEQLRNEPITPACDVYGLGVLLYELLTGNKPLDMSGLTPGEMEQRILSEDPRPPSQNVATESLVGAAAGRDAKPPHSEQSRSASAPADVGFSAKALKGDLDAIVLKCLRKNPQDRYMTVDQLASDLQAHLQGFPVAARRGGGAYRLRRFVGRHRLAVAASAAILIVATFGALTWLRQYRATLEQQSRADQMTSLIMDAIEAADPGGGNAKDMKVRDLFDRIVADTISGDGLEVQPNASLLASLSGIQNRLGLPEQALRVVEKIELAGLSSSVQETVLRAHVESLHALARYDEAKNWLKRAKPLAIESESVAYWLLMEALIDFNVGNVKVALAKLQTMDMSDVGLELRSKGLTLLTRCYMAEGLVAEAKEVADLLLAEQNSQLPEDDPALLDTYQLLFRLQIDAQDLDEAARYAQKISAITERVYPRDSPRFVGALMTAAKLLSKQNKPREAIALHLEALEISARILGPDHPDVAKSHFNLSGQFHDLGELDKVLFHLKEAVDVAERAWLPSDSNLLFFRSIYACQLLEAEQFAEARVTAQRAMRDADAYPELVSNSYYAVVVLVEAIADHRDAADPASRDRMLEAYRTLAAMERSPLAQHITHLLSWAIERQGIKID